MISAYCLPGKKYLPRGPILPRMKCVIPLLLIVFLLCIGLPATAAPVISNHTSTHPEKIPVSAILMAKSRLHIAYWHTSHGSQITTGMSGLAGFTNAPYGG